jgi:hypothetical protein
MLIGFCHFKVKKYEFCVYHRLLASMSNLC